MVRLGRDKGYILEDGEQELAYRWLERKGFDRREWGYVRTLKDGYHVFKNLYTKERIEI